ncbi:MAG: EAL domain-containing protein [Gammaproteobacteria bacterium]
MSQGESLNVLISCESQARLEALVALFREAGLATRAHRVSSARDLGELLRDPQWELLITSDRHPELSPAEALALLTERGSELPCLVSLEEPSPEAATGYLRQGAREVIGSAENERLLRAARRELVSWREHRELVELRARYEETARRAELLLAASQDAIAYVVDGMHVHVNALYAKLFGYTEAEDLASVPLVDLIAASKQKAFKDALKRYRAKPAEQTAIDFTGLRADGGEFAGRLTLSTARYEGEPCMQVLVRALEDATAGAGGTGAASSGPAAIALSVGEQREGHLLLVGIDGYTKHCRLLGVHAADRFVAGLVGLLDRQGIRSVRVADSVLAVVLPGSARKAALESGRHIVASISKQSLGTGAQAVGAAATVVACPLELATRDGPEGMLDRAWTALILAVDRSSGLDAAAPNRVSAIDAPVAAAQSAAGTEALLEDVRSGAFRLLFQPVVSLRGDSTEYYEVQVRRTSSGQQAARWLAENGLAERSLDLDRWVLIESLKKLAAHRTRHPLTRLLVPVVTGALLDADFPQWLSLALRGAELPAESLVLTLLHQDVAGHLMQARHLSEQLRALGAAVCVAEVHPANNPLGDLVELKPLMARMDGALAPALKDPESTNTLLKPMIEALHQDQIAALMPDVEGAGTLAVLWQLGVNYIQGDYLQAPQADMKYDFSDIT